MCASSRGWSVQPLLRIISFRENEKFNRRKRTKYSQEACAWIPTKSPNRRNTIQAMAENIFPKTFFTQLGKPVRNGGFAWRPCWMAGTMKYIYFPRGEDLYCSCHPTWPPCKPSIECLDITVCFNEC